VETEGQFSVRGDILDLWTPDSPEPVRVHFFGDEIERISRFDALTQRSVSDIEGLSVYPASEFPAGEGAAAVAAERIEVAYSEAASRGARDIKSALERRRDTLSALIREGINRQLLSNYISWFPFDTVDMAGYLPPEGVVVFDDIDRACEAVSLRESEAADDLEVKLARGECVEADFEGFAGTADIPELYKARDAVFFSPLARRPAILTKGEIKNLATESFAAKQPALTGGHMPLLISELKRYIKEGFDITIVCSTAGRLENLSDLLMGEGILGSVRLVRGELGSGIEISSSKKVWLWDGDIFKSARRARSRRRHAAGASAIRSFADIKKGDYVVHEAHGIGKYEGLNRLEVQGVWKEYLKIRYSGGDYLYVPVEQTSLIQKYIGGGERAPRVNRLSGGEWRRAKARAKVEIAHMAAELAEMAAKRRLAPGYAFPPDTEWQREFEDRFPYDETDDQLRAIASIKGSMERPEPMDRLLCGDVGYGKTEVALRAVFKCVTSGKQAAVLVPTTLLASQHYATFSERLEDFPFKVDMLSRFRAASGQKKILEGAATGAVDVLIGTHRMLSDDVAFKDLGLLIIDEEHRFGVKHKEKIKRLRQDVDVLSMTATPIPRTLHMSLLGVRDMDLIEEPPEDRYPVQTYVMEESAGIIRETIRRELDRQGQVFAVVSRISSIDRVAAEIARAVPGARVAVGYGQMNETRLEDTMADFIAGSYDVLISTTIIESGIDIPNANTVLIFDADRFGLSQLYQIRGRVGRANRIAFAYLLHRRDKQLSEVAEKRLRTIREFTEFGAGFRIAMRDLEIRGAGNLLGAEQHGHMAAVGYELYCRMVDDAVRALTYDAGKGGGAGAVDGVGVGGAAGDGAGVAAGDGVYAGGAGVAADAVVAAGEAGTAGTGEVRIDLAVSAYIPQSYIEEESDRLETYQRIAVISEDADRDEICADLEDRYGSLPLPVRALTLVALARSLAVRAGEKVLRAEGVADLTELIEKLKNRLANESR
jgi:transcription-repair coupling factor (superfamily II helicase)